MSTFLSAFLPNDPKVVVLIAAFLLALVLFRVPNRFGR